MWELGCLLPSAAAARRIIAAATLAAPAAADEPINWTGLYFGAHGAYTWADIDFPGAPAYPGGPPRQTLEGGFVGLQVGYNYQISKLVLGVEADIATGNITGKVHDGNYIVQTDTIDLIGTVRGRIGYSMGPLLPYLTAGVLWDRGERGQSCPDPATVVAGHCSSRPGALYGQGTPPGPFAPYNLSQHQWHSGFVWGGGVECAINRNLSFKVEGAGNHRRRGGLRARAGRQRPDRQHQRDRARDPDGAPGPQRAVLARGLDRAGRCERRAPCPPLSCRAHAAGSPAGMVSSAPMPAAAKAGRASQAADRRSSEG